ncbi:MAG: sugar phosphate isomerase/epimerase [bacterium]
MADLKIGLDEWSFHNSMMARKMTLEDFFVKAGELGVQGVGFDYFMLPRSLRKDTARLKELLEANSLEPVFGFGVPFALPGAALQLLESRKGEMFEIAHHVGAKVIRVAGGVVVPIMVAKPVHLTLNREKEIERVSRRLKRFVEDAEMEDLTVAIENHSDYTTAEMVEIMERVGSEKLKVTLDTGNAMYLGEDPVETARTLAPHAAYTHIKDMKKQGLFVLSTGLGEGEIDVPAVVNALKESGYGGLYSIEVDLPLWRVGDEVETVAGSVEYLRSLLTPEGGVSG